MQFSLRCCFVLCHSLHKTKDLVIVAWGSKVRRTLFLYFLTWSKEPDKIFPAKMLLSPLLILILVTKAVLIKYLLQQSPISQRLFHYIRAPSPGSSCLNMIRADMGEEVSAYFHLPRGDCCSCSVTSSHSFIYSFTPLLLINSILSWS